MKTINPKQNQSGAALVVGLLLLVVITVLAVSGMNTATTELAMARNDQNYEFAFQAAETGLAAALGQPNFETDVNVVITQNINSHDRAQAIITFECETIVTDSAFSLGVGSGISAYHFNTISQGESKRIAGGGTDTDRDAEATHTQAFYVVGPQGNDITNTNTCSI